MMATGRTVAILGATSFQSPPAYYLLRYCVISGGVKYTTRRTRKYNHTRTATALVAVVLGVIISTSKRHAQVNAIGLKGRDMTAQGQDT